MGIATQRRLLGRLSAASIRHRLGIATFVVAGAGVGASAWFEVPARVEDPAVPDEPVAPAARGALVELGRRLFFDPAAGSRMGMRSCADCHDPAHGYSEARRFSVDDTASTDRHSQTLVDDGDDGTAHWDGVFASI